MPLHYRSQIQEHHVVRQDSGLFYVSHMLAVDITGESATDYLSFLFVNNPQRLSAISLSERTDLAIIAIQGPNAL